MSPRKSKEPTSLPPTSTNTESPGSGPALGSSISFQSPMSPTANCGHPGCISAAKNIKAIHHMKQLFAKAGSTSLLNMEVVDGALMAWCQRLLDCEYDQVSAHLDNFLDAMLQQVDSPVRQDLLARYPSLQLSSTAGPAPAAATSVPQAQPQYMHPAGPATGPGMQVGGGHARAVGGTPGQPQYVARGGYPHAGGDVMQAPAGGYAPPGGYAPGGGYTPAQAGGYPTAPIGQNIMTPAGQHIAPPAGQYIAAPAEGQVTVPPGPGQHTSVPAGQHAMFPAGGHSTVPTGWYPQAGGNEWY